MASVTIQNIRKSYGDVLALSDISIDIDSGAFFTLLGPSGCGKTTLLRTIAGFHFQDSGRIIVDGRPIQDLAAHQRDVGMVFQDYAVFPHLSVADNVAFGLKQRRVPAAEIRTRVEGALRIVQLDRFAARMPHELSGGQQQRVGLARAIVINPTVLLMDEPLSNLDAKLRVDLRAELRRIQKTMGMTTVYVTHDQEEALAMSDIVCVMYGGVIQQAAAPIEIYERPANRFVAHFVGGNNFLRADQDGSTLRLGAGGEAFATHVDAIPEGAVAAIRPEHVIVNPSASPETIVLDATIEHVSFIGREMEVHARLTTGESIKAVARPDATVIARPEGSAITLGLPLARMQAFVDTETGRRLT